MHEEDASTDMDNEDAGAGAVLQSQTMMADNTRETEVGRQC